MTGVPDTVRALCARRFRDDVIFVATLCARVTPSSRA